MRNFYETNLRLMLGACMIDIVEIRGMLPFSPVDRRFTGLLILSASLGRVSKNDALLVVGNAVRPLLGTGMRCYMNSFFEEMFYTCW
jgi:hypothetical protein